MYVSIETEINKPMLKYSILSFGPAIYGLASDMRGPGFNSRWELRTELTQLFEIKIRSCVKAENAGSAETKQLGYDAFTTFIYNSGSKCCPMSSDI